MKLQGTLLLTIISLLERMSFYGVRGVLVLYALDNNGLNINENEAYKFYGILTMLLVILPIPIGLITDKFLGQTKSIYLGGLISSLAYLLFIIPNVTSVYISITLLSIGISFVKPSTTILVGRQFAKEDRSRTLAFIIFFFGINLGAFLGSIIIAFIAEMHGWSLGFAIAAIVTFSYLVLLKIYNSLIIQQETNQLKESEIKLSYRKSIPILLIIILIYTIFEKCSESLVTYYTTQIANSDDKTLLGFDVFDSVIQTLTSLWSIPVTLAIFIYWKIKGIGRIFNLIGLSLLILLISQIVTSFSTKINTDYILDYAIVPFGLYALADAFVFPLVTSYVTRLSDVNYSNTTYALFVFITHSIGGGIIHLIMNEYQNSIIVIVLIGILSLMMVFRKQIRKLTYGIE